MKLNEHSKNELRNEILELLKKVPDGQRVEIPLEVLDELIFLKIEDDKGVIVKFPIWTGKFLRKIDLSKLSFENFVMTANPMDLNDLIDKNKLSKFNKKGGEYRLPFIYDINERNFEGYPIDFSYTNINIDFSKFYKWWGVLEGVNFEGVDLSNSNILALDDGWFNHCNLSNTNITTFPTTQKGSTDVFNVSSTNFSNNDLSKVEFNLLGFINENEYVQDERYFPNLINTGIKFIFDFKNEEAKEYVGMLFEFIEKGFLDGCYLNGKFINSNDYDKVIKEQKKLALREEYENMKKEIFDSTLGSIEEQIKGFGGK